jgi:hypothetical protein
MQQVIVVYYRNDDHSTDLLTVIASDNRRLISSQLDQYAEEYAFERDKIFGVATSLITLKEKNV